MINRRRLFAAGLAPALVAAVDARADEDAPIKAVFPYLDGYYKLPPASRNRFTLAYVFYTGETPLPGVKIDVLSASPWSVTTAANGRILRLPSLAELQSNAKVRIHAPAGQKIEVNLQLEATDPVPALEISVAAVVQTIHQADAAAHTQAGVAGLFVPRFSQMVFPGAGQGWAVAADGTRTPLPLSKRGFPRFNPDDFKTATTLKFAQVPEHLRVVTAG